MCCRTKTKRFADECFRSYYGICGKLLNKATCKSYAYTKGLRRQGLPGLQGKDACGWLFKEYSIGSPIGWIRLKMKASTNTAGRPPADHWRGSIRLLRRRRHKDVRRVDIPHKLISSTINLHKAIGYLCRGKMKVGFFLGCITAQASTPPTSAVHIAVKIKGIHIIILYHIGWQQ